MPWASFLCPAQQHGTGLWGFTSGHCSTRTWNCLSMEQARGNRSGMRDTAGLWANWNTLTLYFRYYGKLQQKKGSLDIGIFHLLETYIFPQLSCKRVIKEQSYWIPGVAFSSYQKFAPHSPFSLSLPSKPAQAAWDQGMPIRTAENAISDDFRMEPFMGEKLNQGLTFRTK